MRVRRTLDLVDVLAIRNVSIPLDTEPDPERSYHRHCAGLSAQADTARAYLSLAALVSNCIDDTGSIACARRALDWRDPRKQPLDPVGAVIVAMLLVVLVSLLIEFPV